MISVAYSTSFPAFDYIHVARQTQSIYIYALIVYITFAYIANRSQNICMHIRQFLYFRLTHIFKRDYILILQWNSYVDWKIDLRLQRTPPLLYLYLLQSSSEIPLSEPFNRNESGRFGAVKIWFNPPFLWVRVIAVFPVFRLLTDFVFLFTYEFCLPLWKIARCSVILLLPLFCIFSNIPHKW